MNAWNKSLFFRIENLNFQHIVQDSSPRHIKVYLFIQENKAEY